MTRFLTIAAGALLAFAPEALLARNILISNDDGLTSNVVALHAALSEAGHDVVVSVPCTNQSGMGAALHIGRPLTPLTEPCLNGAARPGDPGAGAMTREGLAPGDFHYVDGTPVMALMHGIDVVAQQRWGGPPDLVLSGPNEGQNVGAIVLSSGTVSVAQYAAVRGLPAIALSAGPNTEGEGLSNPLSQGVAAATVDLVAALEESAGEDGAGEDGAGEEERLLPRGLALNVNFPDRIDGAEWRITRVGSYNAYLVGFTQNMAESASDTMKAMAKARGMDVPPLPGISFDFNTRPPRDDEQRDESVVYRSAIAVSPMQAGYEYGSGPRVDMAELLSGLVDDEGGE